MGRVASQFRRRLELVGRVDVTTGPFSGTGDPTLAIPEHEMGSPFGNPAGYESPVALRPRLATGVLFRGGRPFDGVQPVLLQDARGSYGPADARQQGNEYWGRSSR